jgi:hypothetical protein
MDVTSVEYEYTSHRTGSLDDSRYHPCHSISKHRTFQARRRQVCLDRVRRTPQRSEVSCRLIHNSKQRIFVFSKLPKPQIASFIPTCPFTHTVRISSVVHVRRYRYVL